MHTTAPIYRKLQTKMAPLYPPSSKLASFNLMASETNNAIIREKHSTIPCKQEMTYMLSVLSHKHHVSDNADGISQKKIQPPRHVTGCGEDVLPKPNHRFCASL